MKLSKTAAAKESASRNQPTSSSERNHGIESEKRRKMKKAKERALAAKRQWRKLNNESLTISDV